MKVFEETILYGCHVFAHFMTVIALLFQTIFLMLFLWQTVYIKHFYIKYPWKVKLRTGLFRVHYKRFRFPKLMFHLLWHNLFFWRWYTRSLYFPVRTVAQRTRTSKCWHCYDIKLSFICDLEIFSLPTSTNLINLLDCE